MLVQEHFCAQRLLDRGNELAALKRFRRVAAWATALPAEPVAASELAAVRASMGWILATRAAPVLDSGNVTSDVLAAARHDLEEAEGHCLWLEQNHPNPPNAHLLRAKIVIAQDDDFAAAHGHLMQAQNEAPNDKRVQEELKKVKIELHKVNEEQRLQRVTEMRDSLKQARALSLDAGREEAVMKVLQELTDTRISWDILRETRIGVEIKGCQEEGGDDVKRLCGQLLGRWKDESKEQRPLWAT